MLIALPAISIHTGLKIEFVVKVGLLVVINSLHWLTTHTGLRWCH